jgi:hypothetical protein
VVILFGDLILQLFLQKNLFLITLLTIKLGKSESMVKTFILLMETRNLIFYMRERPAPGYIFPQSFERGKMLLPERFPKMLIRRGGGTMPTLFLFPPTPLPFCQCVCINIHVSVGWRGHQWRLVQHICIGSREY